MIITLMTNIIKSTLFASLGILLLKILKDKVLNKYTYKLNYIICILITLRMILIFDINIYLPFEFLKIQSRGAISEMGVTIGGFSNYAFILFLVWIIGAIGVMAKNIYNQFLFYRKIENITRRIRDDRILCVLQDEKDNLNIKRNIDVFSVDGLSSPALIGIFNNKIIIPNISYSDNELKWIFKHELTHFKRKDNFFKLLLITASAIHWFNPLINEFKLYIEEQCELSCDEFVLNKSKIEDSKEYALILLNTLKYGNSLKSNIFSSALNTTSHIDIIKNRIEGILSDKKCKRGRLISGLLFTITVISMASFKGISYAQDYETNNGMTLIDKDTSGISYTQDYQTNGYTKEFLIISEEINLDR